uniref:Uncharacterized protein n=1 Tax=Aegilops tauschii subsp. strangulata TaxID=200361 RepID=A0A453Q703_AEGTS
LLFDVLMRRMPSQSQGSSGVPAGEGMLPPSTKEASPLDIFFFPDFDTTVCVLGIVSYCVLLCSTVFPHSYFISLILSRL